MTEGPPTGAPVSELPVSTERVRSGARLPPHVFVLVATLVVASQLLKGAIISGVFWWWGDTYRQVEFVMLEAQVNDGAPFIDGRLEGATEGTRVAAMMVDDGIAPQGAPAEVFAPGKRIRIWHSAAAPNYGVEWAPLNEVSVAARPSLPGLGTLLAYVAATGAVLSAGVFAAAWISRRWHPRASRSRRAAQKRPAEAR